MASSTTAEKKSSKRTTPTASTNGRHLPSTTSSSAIPDTMPTADPFRYFLADFTRSSDEPRHIHPFSIVFLFRFGNRCRPHLVDATSVEINDFEPPTVSIDVLIDIRDSAELLEQKLRNGLILPRSRQRDLERLRELDRRHPARNEIRSIVAFHRRRFCRPFFRVEAAYDRLQYIGTGHHALKRTVFVVHQPHVHRRVS